MIMDKLTSEQRHKKMHKQYNPPLQEQTAKADFCLLCDSCESL